MIYTRERDRKMGCQTGDRKESDIRVLGKTVAHG